MEPASHLWLYAAMAFGIMLLPGLDMAFVTASSLAGGRRMGMAALGGVVAGGACHLLMGAFGVATILQLAPMAFNAVLLGGALYVGWLGVSLLRSVAGTAAEARPAMAAPSRAKTFGRGMLTCLLNPKAYLFTLAVLPQFLKPEQGRLWLQVAALGAITAMAQIVVYGTVMLAGDRLHERMRRHPAANGVLVRSVGALLILTALCSAYQGWRGI